MTWQIETIAQPQDWSQAVAAFPCRSLYGDGVWAAYKAGQGWSCRGILARDGTSVKAAILVQERRISPLGPRLRLIQGGPFLAHGVSLSSALPALLSAAGGGWPVVDMLYPAQNLTPDLEESLPGLGFGEIPVSGDGTVLLDLTQDQESLRAALSKNWRHNLARAEKRGLEVHLLPKDRHSRAQAAQRMAEMYQALTQRKGFAAALDPLALIRAVEDHPDLEVLEIRKDGELLASRMGWMGGDMALDLLAASSDAAKTTYANYLALWSLIDLARQRGARTFDCGGIDPKGNQGVYNFKKGLSGREVALGRLWMKCSPGVLRPLAARLLAARMTA